MSLSIKIAQYGNPSIDGRDKLTLKAEIESPLSIGRSPIIIPLPGGSIVGLDLGRNAASISYAGVVDESLTELFVDTVSGGPFVVGETISGNATWNELTLPKRTVVPSAVVVAGYPSLTSPTSLIVSGLNSTTEFFVDNETITGLNSSATAKVNEPFPTKRRLEHLARFWYSSGVLTLTSRSNTYSVYVASLEFTMEAGLEDRYQFRIGFVEASQGLSSPV